jgi:hypothetical protein
VNQYEEVYDRPRASAFPLTAMGLTYDQACASAKQQLCALGWSLCGTATCQDVVNKLCSDCSIFTGQNAERLALTGSYNCPITPCPLPGTGGGVDFTTILLFAGVAVVGSVAIYALTRQRKPQVMIARRPA